MGLESNDAYTAQLQAILRIAHDIRKVAAVSLPPSHSPSIPSYGPAVMDSIGLPSPPPLLPSLLEAGISSEIAPAANQIYQRRAEHLKQRIQESIATACRTAAEFPAHTSALSPDLFMKRVTSLFTDAYVYRLKEWKEEIIQRAKHASAIPVKEPPRDSRTFNQEYIPLLEHFFEENPFPTRADKMFLAKKSNMEYRQIHVWFQNRRNRTKKDAKLLRKKPTCERVTKPLDKLYERMKGHMVDTDSQVPKPSKVDIATEVEAARDNTSMDTFASPSPLHAFPSTYPPTCNYDPFPCKSGSVYFTKPEWRRVPDGTPPLPLSTSIDDLVERFSHMNVRDEVRCRGCSEPPSHAATAAITVIPSRAPHPSLITRGYRQPVNAVQHYPLVRAPVSSSTVFQSPSPIPKPVTLVPLSISLDTSELPGKRKTVPLPRQFRGRMRNTCRDTTPSESSSTSSTSPRLFSPDYGNRDCSFSSVSSSSTPPDMASTRELPYSFESPCRSLFDSPTHPRNFGDMAATIPSFVS